MTINETINDVVKVDSYFLNALSGEFTSPLIARGSHQSLARLLLSTIQAENLQNPYNERDIYSLKPSWVSAKAIARLIDSEVRGFVLSTEVQRLEFMYSGRDAGSELKINDHSKSLSPIHVLSLSPEADLKAQQQVVTETAQDFFTSIAPMQRKQLLKFW